MPGGTARRWRTAGAVALVVLLAAAVLLRVVALGRLPGVNGDEAWYGVQAQRLLAGGAGVWRTPTGNLPGPLHLGLLTLLQAFLLPSFMLLRVPSVIASLAAMALAYATGRRHSDRATGLVALLLMAALPVSVIYARFGWDPSWAPLACLIAAWFALAGRAVPTAALFALALAVHPTCLFAGPFLLCCFAGARRAAGETWPWQATALQAALLVLAVPVLRVTSSGETAMPPLATMLLRLVDPAEAATFLARFAHLLTGEASLRFIVGRGLGSGAAPAALLLGLVLAGLLAVGGLRLIAARAWRGLGIVAGWLASVAAFYLVAGPEALQPGVERYGLCLLAPTVLAVAVLWRASIPWARLAVGSAMAGAAVLLAAVGCFYLWPLVRTGAAGHRAFVTGPVEPKQAALTHVMVAAPTGAVIVAEDWWSYWPLAYLAAGSRWRVVEASPNASPTPLYRVGFPDGPSERARGSAGAWTAPAMDGRPALRVWPPDARLREATRP